MTDAPPPSRPPPFDDADEQEWVWGARWGCRSEVGRLRTAIVAAAAEDSLTDALQAEGISLFPLSSRPEEPGGELPRDLVAGLAGGAVVTRPTDAATRRHLPAAALAVSTAGCPILRTISGEGLLEGGNLVWLKQDLLAVGLSRTSNEAAAVQLEEVMAAHGVSLLRVPLPGMAKRLEDVLAPIDTDLVLTDNRLLPWFVLERLEAAGLRTIDLAPDACGAIRNSLVLRPGRVLMEAEAAIGLREPLDREGIDLVPLPYWTPIPGASLRRTVAPLRRDPV